MALHLKKLSVGTDNVEDLVRWQKTQSVTYCDQEAILRTTRNTPKQAAELLDGGSMYWIINRRIQCRQNIIGIEQDTDENGRKYCKLFLDPNMIRTVSKPHKPFQGWRYLKQEQAPKDLGVVYLGGENDNPPPPEMENILRAAGLI